MIEFILVFPVILLLVTGIIEFSFLTVAYQTVDLAAFHAARAATVAGDFRKAAVLTCIPISPTAIGPVDPGKIPGAGGLNSVLSSVGGVDHLAEKALFSWFLQNGGPVITYYNSKDKDLEKKSADVTGLDDLKDVSYLKAEVTFYYPLKFPVLKKVFLNNTASNFVTQFLPQSLAGLEFVAIRRNCVMGLN